MRSPFTPRGRRFAATLRGVSDPLLAPRRPLDPPAPAAGRGGGGDGLVPSGPQTPMRQAMPWLIAAVAVLALAVTIGFVAAYLVASSRRAPDAGGVLPAPRATPRVTLAPGQTPTLAPNETEQPRRTPTPAPAVTPEPSPIIHIVRRGEYLSYIAGLYCTTVAAILELNEIEDPDVVSPRTELLIPGGGCPPEASPAA